MAQDVERPEVSFRVQATGFRLRVGDRVITDTLVGYDAVTGRAKKAGTRGRVVTAAFDETLQIFVVAIKPAKETAKLLAGTRRRSLASRFGSANGNKCDVLTG